jgi:cell wall assembly regulator SMI1
MKDNTPPHIDAFRAAIWNKRLADMKKQLAADPSLANAVFLHGAQVTTSLLESVRKNHAPGVAALLQAGADPNMPAPEPEPTDLPLTTAVYDGRLEIVEMLLKAGADPSRQPGTRPWIRPLNCGFASSVKPPVMLAVTKALIDAGGDVNGVMPHTPQAYAAASGLTAVMQMLVDAGADTSPPSLLVALRMALQGGWAKDDCYDWFFSRGIDPAGVFPNEDLYLEGKGLTFVELARKSQNERALSYFEKQTGKSGGKSAKAAKPPKGKPAKDWPDVKAALADAAPKAYESLRPGATGSAVAALEKRIRQTLPADVRAFYLANDGQADGAECFIRGPADTSCHYVLLPLKEARLLADSFGTDEIEQYASEEVKADRGVAKQWCAPGWLAIAENGGGDYYCVDLAPPKSGTIGQIVHFSHESGSRPRVAKSIVEFLRDQVAALKDA